MKDRALISGEKTRTILTQGSAGFIESSIIALPTLSLVKRTIRRHKSLVKENSVSHMILLLNLQVPNRYRFTLKEETFLIYDSGFGDSNQILAFCVPKCYHCWENVRVGSRRYL